MPSVRLIHWNEDEGLERQKQLEALGFDVDFDFGDGPFVLRTLKGGSPEAIVIDLSRLPSHGREVGRSVRGSQTTRHLPIVYVDGASEKVAATRTLLPDATYTTWAELKTALRQAMARPVKNPVVPGLAAGWVDFKVCSVDETWSGLAFKRKT